MKFLLLGNPNVGKTSLFNQMTGASARVGNYPGVTVERRLGTVDVKDDSGQTHTVTLADLPGTYSLSARSGEEQVTLRALLGLDAESPPDAALVVVNASQLSRNLYLVCQILELRVPTVVALNMLDEAGDDAPTPEELSEVLGVPVIATNGVSGSGTRELLEAALLLSRQPTAQVPRLNPKFPNEIVRAADRIVDVLPQRWRGSVERDRSLSLWAISSLDPDDELLGIPEELRARTARVQEELSDPDLVIVRERYRVIDQALESTKSPRGTKKSHSTSETIDRFLLHPIGGFVAFLTTMFVVFEALFSWADPAIGWIEDLVAQCQTWAVDLLPSGILRDLLVEGVLGGVGNVIVFLPQILLLFLFIGLLEDSGYMARIAYLMDRIMQSLGLHGRAFVPMLSGFACAIPAIMATRTLERRRDQLLTMMVVPLMTCSARLPVYTLIIGALFPPQEDGSTTTASLLMVGMYVFSVLTALIAAFVLSRTVIPGRSMPLLLELPSYRLPRLVPTLRMMKTRAGQFLHEAGTVILAATVVLWVLLSFPRVDASTATISGAETTAPVSPNPASKDAIERKVAPPLEESYAGVLARKIEPVMKPLGFDWKITTGIIGAFAAREVFVSTLGLVFGIEDMDEEALPLRDRIRNERAEDGTPKYSPLMGLSLMVFFALACQCMSTLAVVRRETGGYRWPLFLFGYMTTLAYVASLLVFQGGKLLGY